MMNDFVNWLNSQLDQRNLNRSQLAERAGIAKSTLSMIYSQNRSPGADVCRAIAQALSLPEEIVFRAAGLLPTLSADSSIQKELLYYFDRLSPDRQREAVELLRFQVSLAEQRGQYDHTADQPEKPAPRRILKPRRSSNPG